MRIHLFIVIMCALSNAIKAEQPQLLLIDTHGCDVHHYQPLLIAAQSAGFSTRIMPLFALLDGAECKKANVVIVASSSSLIAHLGNNTAQLIEKAVRRCIAHANPEITCLLLPERMSSSAHYLKNVNEFVHDIFGTIGIQLTRTPEYKQFIEHSTNRYPGIFETSLFQSDEKKVADALSKKPFAMPKKINAHALNFWTIPMPHSPLLKNESVKKISPTALFMNNPDSGNTICIALSLPFSVATESENFFITPIDAQEREALLSVGTILFDELNCALSKKTHCQRTKLHDQLSDRAAVREKRLSAPDTYRLLDARYEWVRDTGISCAWLDFNDFFAKNDTIKKMEHELKDLLREHGADNVPQKVIDTSVEETALNRGVHIIFEARFTMLWIEFLPEWYLAGDAIKAEQKEEYKEQVKRLARALKEEAENRNRSLPKIFIGMNITSNFRNRKPIHQARDIYGTLYPNIPSALERHEVWQKEVLDVFDELIKVWPQEVPIAGVFFDLEMYHAQKQAGGYGELMDFSGFAWHRYCNARNLNNYKKLPFKERIAYLNEHKLFTDYHQFLEKDALKLGASLKRAFHKRQPDLLFGAYAPTLPNSWFYRGFLAGLSSPSEPVIYASFNTTYFPHHAWLLSKNIYLLHGQAAMLSKFKTPADCAYINEILKRHHFVWFNKPSRMLHDYSAKELERPWWGIEASPMDPGALTRCLQQARE